MSATFLQWDFRVTSFVLQKLQQFIGGNAVSGDLTCWKKSLNWKPKDWLPVDTISQIRGCQWNDLESSVHLDGEFESECMAQNGETLKVTSTKVPTRMNFMLPLGRESWAIIAMSSCHAMSFNTAVTAFSTDPFWPPADRLSSSRGTQLSPRPSTNL